MVLQTCLIEASIINTHSPFPGLLFNKNRIGKPVKVVYLLDEVGCQEFGDHFAYGPTALVVEASRRCLAGFKPRIRRIMCSVTSRGMPGMSKGFHVKTS